MPKHMEVNKRKYIQILLIVLSIVFIAFGAYRGEIESVFSKAIKLCLECVGIG